ncbi:MAG: HAD family hydrolase [Psychrilyobacter sp.]|uniref:HAD family hydrolase n=1 Tax=Psychrilyobacter sp. TaxID=2586924 RepID=UPI003C76A74D
MIKLIATDMDGTLLNSKHEINPEFWEVWGKLKEKNIVFACASGRQYYNLIKKFENIKDDIYFIAENGSFVAYKGEILHINILDRKKTFEFIELARTIDGVNVVLCGKNSAYVELNDSKFIEEVKPYYEKFEIVNSLEEVEDDFLKIALCDFKNSEENSYKYFKEFENEYKITVSGGVWLDISNLDANKGTAMRKLQKILGITPKETLVFGDYLNDIELLESGEHSYAMENAHPKLKELAKNIAKSNEENGVVEKIKELFKL